MLFVGYHQRYAIDVALLVSTFYDEFGVLLRGLAHPEVMNNEVMQNILSQFARWMEIGLLGADDDPLAASPPAPGGDAAATAAPATAANAGVVEARRANREKEDLDSSVNNQFVQFGAVPVTGKNFVRLLKAGENILLFPGGVREAFHLKGEEHQLFWPETAEFVRAAARYGATIVPFAAVGAAESFPLLLDQDELAGLPVVGENLRRAGEQRLRVREDELFSAPVGVPLPPERFYFLFGEPLDLAGVDPGDRGRCTELYAQVRGEVEAAVARLLRWRRLDPHRRPWPRWDYQARHPDEEVPSFDLDEAQAARRGAR